jgi:Kdo2-lipid IVA lauroyltransferase/acyltransferase
MTGRARLRAAGYAIEAAFARAGFALLRRLGPVRASNLAGGIARAIGPWLPVSRVAHANLAAAMPELDEAARRRIVAGVWESLGRTVGELPHLPALRQRTESGIGWELADEAPVLEARAAGRPVLYVGGHIANWEMLQVAAYAYGMPFASLYRPAANAAIDAMVLAMRAAGTEQQPLFAKGARGARGAMAHVSRGGNLGALIDQKMNDGVQARLFGLPAMTVTAPAAIARRYGCTVLGAWSERLGPARYRVHVERLELPPENPDRAADLLACTQMMNDALERWIRARPETWLWLHRRWPKEVVKT